LLTFHLDDVCNGAGETSPCPPRGPHTALALNFHMGPAHKNAGEICPTRTESLRRYHPDSYIMHICSLFR